MRGEPGNVVGWMLLALLLLSIPRAGWASLLPSPDVVISQVYGGGGNMNAPYRNDYIELLNRSNTPVNVSGWSVQYAASTGSAWQLTNLSGVIQPGQYYLIQEGSGGANGVLLPAPDVSGNILMGSMNGKVALVTNQTLLSCGGSSPACLPNSAIRDFVGYGNADNYEGTGPAPSLSNTTAAIRGGNGCRDTDNNSTDFTAGSPNPRNSSSPTASCNLVVTLASFAAESVGDDVRVTWETVLEVGNVGFNLYRATTPTRPATPLNPTLIPSQAPGGGQGFGYEWWDETAATGATYFYWLEDVDTQGHGTLHGPVSVEHGGATAVRLDELDARPARGSWARLAGMGAAGLLTAVGARRRRRRTNRVPARGKS